MRLLAIYFNDKLALGVAGRELARRAERENAGTELGTFLQQLALEVTKDVDTLERIMKRLDLPLSSVKRPLALVAERVARHKPNGRGTGVFRRSAAFSSWNRSRSDSKGRRCFGRTCATSLA